MERGFSKLPKALLARLRDWYREDGSNARRDTRPGVESDSSVTAPGPVRPIRDSNLTSSKRQLVEVLETAEPPVWQSSLVEATEVSKSTVSRSLSDLEDAGVVVRTRIGRRKVVFLAGEEPDVIQQSNGPSPEQPPKPVSPEEPTVDAPATDGPSPDEAVARADSPDEHSLDD